MSYDGYVIFILEILQVYSIGIYIASDNVVLPVIGWSGSLIVNIIACMCTSPCPGLQRKRQSFLHVSHEIYIVSTMHCLSIGYPNPNLI